MTEKMAKSDEQIAKVNEKNRETDKAKERAFVVRDVPVFAHLPLLLLFLACY